jgi:hypothetical protein
MEDKQIVTKRGVYGRVNITLPLTFKNYVLDLQNKTGMKKAEFLRLSLMMGAEQLVGKVLANSLTGVPSSGTGGIELSAHRT